MTNFRYASISHATDTRNPPSATRGCLRILAQGFAPRPHGYAVFESNYYKHTLEHIMNMNKHLQIRLTEEEKQTIQTEAERASISSSEYLRRRALGKRVVSHYDESVYNEIRRLGGLQKHLASVYPRQREQFDQVLQEIIVFIKQLDKKE